MSQKHQVKLGEIAHIQTGPFGSQLHQRDYVEIGTPIITVEHLGDNNILYNKLPCVSDSDKERLKKYLLSEGDIVFSRVGSVDRRAYVKKKEEGWLFSGRCLRVRCFSKKVSSRFLSYYFGQEAFKEYIRMIAVGATMPSINTEILSNVDIILPSIQEQEHIVSILSSFDDKIDLLYRQNKTLEALAETYFRQWFIEEAREEWSKVNIGDIVTINYGKSLPDQIRKNGNIPVYSSAGLTGYHNESLADREGIVIGRKGTIGTVYWVNSPFFTIDTAYYITQTDSKVYIEYLYYLLKSYDLSELNEDSAVPGLNRNTLYSLEVSLPPKEKILVFKNLIKMIFNKSFSNRKQINTLMSLRNTLLPKLLSGEIKVKM